MVEGEIFKMKRIVYLLVFLLCGSFVLGFDAFDSESYNVDYLPVNDSFNLSLSLLDNHTIFLSEINGSDHIDLFFPENVTLNGVNDTTVLVNYTINYFPLAENITINKSLLITNNLNNNSFTYGLIFDLYGDFSIVQEEEFFDVKILNNAFHVDITTNILPAEGSSKFELSGLSGERVNLSCQSWLDCPEYVVFDSSNKTIFTVDWEIPLDAVEGVTKRAITFDWQNDSKEDFITFNVSEPDITVNSWVWDVERCFDVLNQSIKYDCWLEYEEYQLARANQLVARAMALGRNTCNCTNTTNTEYVVFGNVTAEVGYAYEQCVTDRTESTKSFNDCSADLSDSLLANKKIFDKYTDCKTNLANNETNYRAQCFAAIKAKDAEIDRRVSKTFWITFSSIISTIVLIILILWIRHNRRGMLVQP